MNLIQFQGAIELGLIYSILALGVFLSFRVLDFPDLTVDGSFPLGAAVTAALLVVGVDPVWATLIAFLVGSVSGSITAFMSTRLKIFGLLAGILNMSALYSINLRIMGNRPNISLLSTGTLFKKFDGIFPQGHPSKLYVLVLIVGAVIVLVGKFMGSQIGLALRSTGNNSRMAQAQGVDEAKMITLGLAISNGLVALSGSLFCQSFGFADVTLGVGTIIIGLASLILGEALFPTRSIWGSLLAASVGAVVYRVFIALALGAGDIGLQPSDLNLISAVLITLSMGVPSLKRIFKKTEVVRA
jgi:putative ABC transport system permease protein